VKKGEKVVLLYSGQMDPIVKAVIVQFFQLLAPQQAFHFFYGKFHLEISEAAKTARPRATAK
jgi:hypothetical protein